MSHSYAETLTLTCAVPKELAARAAGDPIWLAYSVCPRPNARLAWDALRILHPAFRA